MDIWLIVSVLVVVTLATAYIALIRPWHLHWGATVEEVCATLPGDDLVARPESEATHAVTIDTSPARVWPWLLQLGQDRAGFYSYTWLENLFGCQMRNTLRIVPEWQHLAVGDGVLLHPKMPRVPVAVVDAQRALVIGGPLDEAGLPAGASRRGDAAAAWAFVLRDIGPGQTRLIARLRLQPPRTLRYWLAGRLFWEPAHFIMERKMLRTIKRLAEAADC